MTLTLLHWICDFGRGIYAFYVSETFPMSLPSIGDYGPEQWYLVTEGQIFPMFLVMLIAMVAVWYYQSYHGRQMDSNGRWLLYRSLIILMLVGVWSVWLWNDATLKKRYPELLYVPEPCTLHPEKLAMHNAESTTMGIIVSALSSENDPVGVDVVLMEYILHSER